MKSIPPRHTDLFYLASLTVLRGARSPCLGAKVEGKEEGSEGGKRGSEEGKLGRKGGDCVCVCVHIESDEGRCLSLTCLHCWKLSSVLRSQSVGRLLIGEGNFSHHFISGCRFVRGKGREIIRFE